MQQKYLELFENSGRKIPLVIYFPIDYKEDNNKKYEIVIFGNGFQGQSRFEQGLDYYCKNYTWLAKFFTEKNYIFISLQFEIQGDKDELPELTKGQKVDQIKERTPLWIKDEKIILIAIEELKKQYLNFNFDKFIIAGHSNGADVAKFFANLHSNNVSHVISFDGRRCPVSPFVDLKLLSFEANDTTTDDGVIPGRQGFDPLPGEREKLEYVIVKPKKALHRSYTDSHNDIDDENSKLKAIKTIDWFLENF